MTIDDLELAAGEDGYIISKHGGFSPRYTVRLRAAVGQDERLTQAISQSIKQDRDQAADLDSLTDAHEH